jgi:hypothetical protein
VLVFTILVSLIFKVQTSFHSISFFLLDSVLPILSSWLSCRCYLAGLKTSCIKFHAIIFLWTIFFTFLSFSLLFPFKCVSSLSIWIFFPLLEVQLSALMRTYTRSLGRWSWHFYIDVPFTFLQFKWYSSCNFGYLFLYFCFSCLINYSNLYIHFYCFMLLYKVLKFVGTKLHLFI